MENIRLLLISLHVLIAICLVYNLHPHLSLVGNAHQSDKQIASIIGYLSHFVSIVLYQSSCIIAIWHSRRFGAGMIRASGVLLIGEFLQMLTGVIQNIAELHGISNGERFLDVIYVCIFSAAIVITFRLANKISKHEKNRIHLELLTTAVSEESMDGRGEFALI